MLIGYPCAPMESQRLVFPNLVEGLVRATGDGVTPALKAQLRERGLDLDKKFPPAWETTHVKEWFELFAAAKSPGVPREEALRRLGQGFMEGWRGTLVGGAMSIVLRTIGPDRSLSRLERAFRTGDNFTTVTVTPIETPPPWRLAHIRFNEVFGCPEYFVGLMEAGSAFVGAKNPEVQLEALEGPGVLLRVRYQP